MPRGSGWGTFHSSPPYRTDDPPGAPKISESGGVLRKSRLGKEKLSFVQPFDCQRCLEKPATKQMPKCGHILCLDCLVEQGGECPLC